MSPVDGEKAPDWAVELAREVRTVKVAIDALTNRESSELVSVKEVAAFIGVSTRTIWRLVAQRELPTPFKVGRGATRWSRADIESAVANLTQRRARQ